MVRFGTGTRPPLQDAGGDGPGPGAYKIRTTIMTGHPLTKFKSTPAYSLKGREKFGANTGKSDDPACRMEPGPGAYKFKAMGNDKPVSFPKKPARPPPVDINSRRAPGPGAYPTVPACGVQCDSTKPTLPIAAFQGAERFAVSRLRALEDSVGPGDYKAENPFYAPQLSSTRRSVPQPKFGTVTRETAPIGARMSNDLVPGAGKYKLPSGLCGKGSGYPTTWSCAPRVVMSGRTSFGSPFRKVEEVPDVVPKRRKRVAKKGQAAQ